MYDDLHEQLGITKAACDGYLAAYEDVGMSKEAAIPIIAALLTAGRAILPFLGRTGLGALARGGVGAAGRAILPFLGRTGLGALARGGVGAAERAGAGALARAGVGAAERAGAGALARGAGTAARGMGTAARGLGTGARTAGKGLKDYAKGYALWSGKSPAAKVGKGFSIAEMGKSFIAPPPPAAGKAQQVRKHVYM